MTVFLFSQYPLCSLSLFHLKTGLFPGFLFKKTRTVQNSPINYPRSHKSTRTTINGQWVVRLLDVAFVEKVFCCWNDNVILLFYLLKLFVLLKMLNYFWVILLGCFFSLIYFSNLNLMNTEKSLLFVQLFFNRCLLLLFYYYLVGKRERLFS